MYEGTLREFCAIVKYLSANLKQSVLGVEEDFNTLRVMI